MSERPEAFIELLPPDVGHNLRHFGPETHHLTGEECHCSPEQVPHEAVAARPATLTASEAREVAYAEAIWGAQSEAGREVVMPEDFAHEARAVMAVADAEQAERLAQIDAVAETEWHRRAESAEAALVRVRALADAFADDGLTRHGGNIAWHIEEAIANEKGDFPDAADRRVASQRERAESAEAERDAALAALASQDTYTEDGGLIVVGQLREQRARAESAEAEVERLRGSADRAHQSARRAGLRAESAGRARDAALAEVTELRDRLGRVEALRDRWLAVDVPSAEVTSWSHYAGAALRAALAVPVTGDTETASPAAEDTTEDCGRRVGSKPWWMGSDQYDPCHCLLPKGHDGECKCSHTLEDAGAASPTEQATEGGA